MDASNIIDFGIFEDFSITFNTSNITNIFPLNHRECFASTSKEIVRFERKFIKMRYPYTFSSCIIVPDTEYFIGVTLKRGTFIVFRLSDASEPILKDYQTNHHGIFHMFYSQKSNSVITIGSGIHVFTFHYLLPDKKVSIVNPKVSFTERSSFATDYDTTILAPPPFDPETELIYLPTSNGICPFTLDGKQLNPYTKIPATIKTVYTFNNQSKELLSYDSIDGMSLWGPSDNLICHISTAGSSLIALLFVDQENVICLNSYNSLFFLNIKTGRTFHCITMQKRPTRLFLIYLQNQPILFVCFANMMKAMKIVIPWHVWNINVKETIGICRCNKFCESARILVATSSSFIKLYAPKTSEKVTVATPSLAVNSSSFLYDRGVFELYTFNKEKLEFSMKIEKTLPGNERDFLFIVLENGKIIGFNTAVSPCEEVMSIKSKAAFITVCRYNEKWCYAVASENSDLYILDYQKLNEIHHFTVVNDKLLKFFFHYESDSIVMIFEKKTLLFDLKKGQIGNILKIDGNKVTSLFSNMLKYGYESGHIAHVEIEDGKLIPFDNSAKQRPHSEAVTCFSFSLNFWISLGDDGRIIFWDYGNEKICQLSFPIALRAGIIMNGKRDILAATESEVMIIEGSYIFGKSGVDREISEIDNFDRLSDNLSSEVIFPLPSHEDDDQESLLNSRKSDADSYEYDKEEEEVKREVTSTLSSTLSAVDSPKIEKKMIVEDSEEDKMKKLEAMQALNGVKKKPPELENLLKEERKASAESNEKKKEKSKKSQKKKTVSRHDENSLKNFIEDSMELEKEKKETKPKKEKANKSKSNDDDGSTKSIKTMKNNSIEKVCDSSEKVDDSNQKSETNDDDSDNLVLKMKINKKSKTEKQKQIITNEEEPKVENQQANDETKDSQETVKPENEPNPAEEKNSESKSNHVKEKNSKNEPNSPKDLKPPFEKVSPPKTAENNKSKNRVSIGTQPDNESNSKQEKKGKTETKKNQTDPIEKAETKDKKSSPIEKVETKKKQQKPIEKVEPKKENEKDPKKVSKKPKSEKVAKSGNKSKRKETKMTIKPPSSSPSPEQPDSRTTRETARSRQKVCIGPKSDSKSTNFNASGIERKTIKPPPQSSEKSDPLFGKRPRCPTPPLVRWKKPALNRKPAKRASTPPMRNARPIMFSIPPPNIVLDKPAILEFYGRGKTELKPLVDLIYQENERIKLSLLYYRSHVKNFGSLNRVDSSSFFRRSQNWSNSSINRFFYRNQPYADTFFYGEEGGSKADFGLPPTRPFYYGYYFFNDEETCEMKDHFLNANELENVNDNRKSEVTHMNENLPKLHEMKYAPPLNLVEQGRRQPTIRIPQNASRKSQVHKRSQNVMWPDSDSKSGNIESDEGQPPRITVSQRNDVSQPKPPKAHNVQSARNLNSNSNFECTNANWSLFYSNFESCNKCEYENEGNSRNGVDLLARAVMSKVPSLELPVSNGFKRTKSVRIRSPPPRRIVPSPFFHPNERKKKCL